MTTSLVAVGSRSLGYNLTYRDSLLFARETRAR